MDLATLAVQAVGALAPALPFLLDKGGKAADAAIEKIGEDAWEKAKSVWARLRGKVAEDADPEKSAEKTVEKLARDPENGRLHRVLAPLLEGLLEGDDGTVEALRALLGAPILSQRAENLGAGAIGQAAEGGTAIVAGSEGTAFGGHQINIEVLHLYVQSIVTSLVGSASPPDLERSIALGSEWWCLRVVHSNSPVRAESRSAAMSVAACGWGGTRRVEGRRALSARRGRPAIRYLDTWIQPPICPGAEAHAPRFRSRRDPRREAERNRGAASGGADRELACSFGSEGSGDSAIL